MDKGVDVDKDTTVDLSVLQRFVCPSTVINSCCVSRGQVLEEDVVCLALVLSSACAEDINFVHSSRG